MLSKTVKIFYLGLVFMMATLTCSAQKLIEYAAGMGSRDPNNSDIWILYQRVRATHEGMILYADSALLNNVQNDFTAYRRIKIVLTDTTTITGDRLYYDGNKRIVDIWADTVVLIDGKTILKTNHIQYDRNTSKASYTTWGHAVNGNQHLFSRKGYYSTELKEFYIYNDVVLWDPDSRLETDTLLYNTITEKADFVTPTTIYSDSSVVMSDRGSYYTGKREAVSVKNSRVFHTQGRQLFCDTLDYFEATEHGFARGNVKILDTINDITCIGKQGETDQKERTSMVTDSALVILVDNGDTIWLHADSIFLANSKDNELESMWAFRHVKGFRKDLQGMCDSIYYSGVDSVARMYGEPVIWYDSYQSTADTMHIWVTQGGVKKAELFGNTLAVEKVDAQKYNQVKGKNSVVYFKKNEPDYADVLGSAQMVYYVTEEGESKQQYLVGVNVGIGSDMRIYFSKRSPERVVTYGKPDMQTYPPSKLPEEKSKLQGFKWMDVRRPKCSSDVFIW